MTDDLRLLNRLGIRLDPPDGPPAGLRDRVMAELMSSSTPPLSSSTPPRQATRRRRWSLQWSLQWPHALGRSTQTSWLLPTVAAAVVAAALISVAGGMLPSSGTDVSRPLNAAPAPGAAKAQQVDTSVFQGGDTDYVVFQSPVELARAEGITAVFVGEVQGFSQGRVLSSPGSEEGHVVMKVSVGETFKGPRDGAGFAYVEVPQRICAGDVPCATVADFTRAIPADTKVLVFGGTAAEVAPPGDQLVNNNAGRPAGAQLIQPYPQGLLFESATATGVNVVGAYEQLENMTGAWRKNPAAGIDGLTAELRAAP